MDRTIIEQALHDAEHGLWDYHAAALARRPTAKLARLILPLEAASFSALKRPDFEAYGQMQRMDDMGKLLKLTHPLVLLSPGQRQFERVHLVQFPKPAEGHVPGPTLVYEDSAMKAWQKPEHFVHRNGHIVHVRYQPEAELPTGWRESIEDRERALAEALRR